MSDPPSYDNDLLARLNALKRTNVSLEHERYFLHRINPKGCADNNKRPSLGISKEPASHEDALSVRLKFLRNGSQSSPSTHKGTVLKESERRVFVQSPDASYSSSDIALDQEDGLPSILQLSKSSSDWDNSEMEAIGLQSFKVRADAMMERMKLQQGLSKSSREAENASEESNRKGKLSDDGEAFSVKEFDTADARNIQASADRLLAHLKQQNSTQGLSGRGDFGGYDPNEADSTDLEAEAREAEVMLAQLMDETNLEMSDDGEEETAKHPDSSKHDTKLPSTPSHLTNTSPSTTQDSSNLDFESSMAARMAALKVSPHSPRPSVLPSPPTTIIDSFGLPSAPTTLPSKAAAVPPPKPKEPEDWCNICYANATIVCHGCDNEFFCARCWKEGHTGPDVDWEDRSHEWSSYRRPR